MDLSMKPSPVIAIWLPGFSLIMFVLLSLYEWSFTALVKNPGFDAVGLTLSGIVVLIIAFVLGQLLDAIRDAILENFLFERLWPVRWEFFFEGPVDKINNLDEWYYTWYEFDANIVVAILVAIVLGIFNLILINPLTYVLMIIAMFFFFWDACELRHWTQKLIDEYYKELDQQKPRRSTKK